MSAPGPPKGVGGPGSQGSALSSPVPFRYSLVEFHLKAGLLSSQSWKTIPFLNPDSLGSGVLSHGSVSSPPLLWDRWAACLGLAACTLTRRTCPAEAEGGLGFSRLGVSRATPAG